MDFEISQSERTCMRELAKKGVSVEFIMRDVYTVHGNLGKVKRAVEIARAEIDRHYEG